MSASDSAHAGIVATLKRARYKILVAVRPLPSARIAFNLVVAEFAAGADNATDRAELNSLKLEEGN